ncbi:MAG: hypothetical protein KAI93_15555, partial [Desulfobacterales bacterium]|nr:hypothetical protein [Desulfobacterales bacterium]
FQRFIVYQPSGKKVPDEMQSWVETNVMEVRVPDQTDDQMIEKVVKDFRSFASLHYDSKNLKTAALLGQHGAIPFFSETSTSRIVSDLKTGGSSDSAETGSDPLFCARVFLGFAQDFDRQGDELNQGLDVHAQQSFELLKTLKGETEIDSAAIPLATESEVDDPGEYMALARLQAWALLFQKDPVGSGLFVTSSKSVFNQLMARVPATEKIFQSAGLPADKNKDQAFNAWRDSFLKHLNGLSETHWSASKEIGVDLPLKNDGGTDFKLTLYLVPGQIPGDFFAQYLEARHPPKKQPNQKAKFKNTLVGLVECQP